MNIFRELSYMFRDKSYSGWVFSKPREDGCEYWPYKWQWSWNPGYRWWSRKRGWHIRGIEIYFPPLWFMNIWGRLFVAWCRIHGHQKNGKTCIECYGVTTMDGPGDPIYSCSRCGDDCS